MSGTDAAAMVPETYDVVIDGFGYVTARAVDPNLPFRVQQAALSYTPTFLERTNVGAAYGDDQQAFFLTASMRNFTGGEHQKFFKNLSDTTESSFWQSQALDNSVAGELSLLPDVTSTSINPKNVKAMRSNAWLAAIWVADTSNLLSVATDGTSTDKGAHGLGATPSRTGLAADRINVFITTTDVGTVGIRKYNGAAYSTFSATGADSLIFHNNALYGIVCSTGSLITYSTAGVASTVYQWKNADGVGSQLNLYPSMGSNGGTLLMAFGNELWQYDGSATNIVAKFPENFQIGVNSGHSIAVAEGVVFVAGGEFRTVNGASQCRPAVYAYTPSQTFLVWKAQNWATDGTPAQVVSFANGAAFNDPTSSRILYYDLGSGSVTGIAASTMTAIAYMASGGSTLAWSNNGVTVNVFPKASTVVSYPTSGFISTSLFDFENSLTKLFRGIAVDWTAATDGDGGSIDIAYQVNSVDGNYTTLKTGAVSGTEYALTSISGRSISVKVTVNKGTSTAGPKLKKIYVRGVPLLQAYRMFDYIFDLGGDANTGVTVRRRDQSDHNLSGEAMRANLTAALQSATPVSVTDRTGTYTAVLEPANCEFDLTQPGQWYARIRVREV